MKEIIAHTTRDLFGKHASSIIQSANTHYSSAGHSTQSLNALPKLYRNKIYTSQETLTDDSESEVQSDYYAYHPTQNAYTPIDPACVFPIHLSNLKSTKSIGLCSLSIIKLSNNLSLLKKTKTLELCCNCLVDTPPEIAQMTSLKSLSLMNNTLTSVTDTIGQLHNLKRLYLSGNYLIDIPSSIGDLLNLKHLDLSYNLIHSLPQELGRLSRLKELNISHNPITRIPVEISRLKTLKSILFEGCAFTGEDANNALVCAMPLKELAARVVIRKNIHPSPLPSIVEYLDKQKTCSECGGPFFDAYFVRYRMIRRGYGTFKVEHKMCVNHWNNEAGRVRMMFSGVSQYACDSHI